MTVKQELTLQLLWTRSISLRLDLRIKDRTPLNTELHLLVSSSTLLYSAFIIFKLSHGNEQKRLIPAPHVDVEQDVLPNPTLPVCPD